MARIRVEEVPPQIVAVQRRQVAVAGLPAFIGGAAAAVEDAVGRAGGVVAGPLFGWYHAAPADVADVSVGFVVAGLPVGDLGDVEVVLRPGSLAAVALHVGPYGALEETYRELEVWLDTRQLDPSDELWEEYLSDPEADPDPTTWQTRLVRPLV